MNNDETGQGNGTPATLSVATMAAARRLEALNTPGLATQVEALLDDKPVPVLSHPDADSLELAVLVVKVSSLAWNILDDMRKRGKLADRDMVTRAVQIQLGDTSEATADIIRLIIDEIFDLEDHGEDLSPLAPDTENPPHSFDVYKGFGEPPQDTPYPILEARSLRYIPRTFLRSRRRNLSDLPQENPGHS
jgi:hypothetical protein